MNTLSQHFFMEVLVKKMHTTVDKYATLNREGNAILYTTKAQPKDKKVISLAEGKRIFEDLYGNIATRWETTQEFTALQARKNRAAKRRAR
jgi:hypothetical protein